MRNPSALRKSIRGMLPVAIVSVLASLPSAATAQQMADRLQDTAPSSAKAPPVVSTEGARRAIIFTYLDGNLIQQYKYYWWHDGCYLTYETNNFAPVPPSACE